VGKKRKGRNTLDDHTLVTPVSPETRAGVPLPTPDAVTDRIIITHDGVRGVAYKKGGITKIGNSLSGTI